MRVPAAMGALGDFHKGIIRRTLVSDNDLTRLSQLEGLRVETIHRHEAGEFLTEVVGFEDDVAAHDATPAPTDPS